MGRHLPEWYNWQTAIATLGITSLGFYTVKQLRRFVRRHGRRIVDGLFWAINRIATQNISTKMSMRRYCRAQRADESTKYLQVPGIRGAALHVDDVFVPLTLELGGRRKRFSSSNILAAGNRLVVAGDPGSGKTTLIKRLLRESCLSAIRAPRKERLPVWLELKTLTPPKEIDTDIAGAEWLYNKLRAMTSKVEGFEMDQLFDACVKNTGILVLLDGLDEVSSEHYPAVATALRGLSQRLSQLSEHNSIVLTSRIQFYHQVRMELVSEYPQTLYVSPFTPNEIYILLNRWPFEAAPDKNVTRIYSDLTDRPTLREMCSNPLVLAMYVQNDQESDIGEMPETRTEFYRKVVNELLVMRRRRQEIVSGRSISLREQRESILGKLAFENLSDARQPANSLSWRRAIEVSARIWDCSPSQAERELRALASETGIITEERSGESFRFIHLTFCEYLAAIECANGIQDGWKVLLDAHRGFVASDESNLHARLVEVIPFAHALLSRVQRPGALRDVVATGDQLVTGRCFLETQLYDMGEWSRYVSDEEQHLAQGSHLTWDETKLRRLHLFSVVVRDAQDWMKYVARRDPDASLDEVFTTIVAGNRRKMVAVFEAYVSQDAAAAFRLAERIGVDMLAENPELLIESCQEAAFLALALERVEQENKERSTQWMKIVTEGALRYTNAAYGLYVHNPTSLQLDHNDKYHRQLTLSTRPFRSFAGSSYCLFLNAILVQLESKENLEIADNGDLRLFPALTSTSIAYSRNQLAYFVFRSTGLLGLVPTLLAMLCTLQVISSKNFLAGFLWLILAFGFVALTSILTYYGTYYRDLYRAILNLGAPGLQARRFVRSRGGPLGRKLLKRQRRMLARILTLRPGMGSEGSKVLL